MVTGSNLKTIGAFQFAEQSVINSSTKILNEIGYNSSGTSLGYIGTNSLVDGKNAFYKNTSIT